MKRTLSTPRPLERFLAFCRDPSLSKKAMVLLSIFFLPFLPFAAIRTTMKYTMSEGKKSFLYYLCQL